MIDVSFLNISRYINLLSEIRMEWIELEWRKQKIIKKKIIFLLN